MDSYDVRVWDIKKLGSGPGARFRVRWAVNGREHCRSFKGRPLADGFLAGLKDAVRDRRPFSPAPTCPTPRSPTTRRSPSTPTPAPTPRPRR